LEGEAMGIWLELGIFGLVFVFAFWQMHDVRKAQEQTRQQRAREKAAQEAKDQEAAGNQLTGETDNKS
jgi:heme exporter protein D